jgi:hypothetical protein
MADIVFNIAKGKVNELVKRVDADDPVNSALIVVLLKATGLEADSVLRDYDDLSTLLAAANDECDFTNYARKTLIQTDLAAPTPDDVNDRQDADFGDQTWTAAGGGTNNSIGALLVCYDSDTTSGTDANIVPLTKHDFVVTTNGTDLTATVANFFRAS